MTDAGPWQDYAPSAPAGADNPPWQDYAPSAGQGGPPLPKQPSPRGMPAALIQRIASGDALNNTAKAAAQGFGEGWNSAGNEPFIDSDIYHSPYSLRSYGAALLNPFVEMGKDLFVRLPNAVIGAAAKGGAQAAEEVGLTGGRFGTKETAERDFSNMGDYAVMSGDILNFGVRPAPNDPLAGPSGDFHDQIVGPIPKPEEVPQQADAIAQHYGVPAAGVLASYDHAGALPAETLHAMESNPNALADIAVGETPRTFGGEPGRPAPYPVADWTGAPVKEPERPAGPAGQPVGGEQEGPPAAETPAPEAGVGRGGLRPVEGTGETKLRQLPQSVERAAETPLGELPEYNVVTDEEQRTKAAALADRRPDDALAIAMGTKAPPRGVLPEAVYVEVLKRANAAGDYQTQMQLARSGLTTQATTMGQRISYLRNVAPDDPVEAIRSVQDARAAALKARGLDTEAETEKAVQAVRQARVATASKPGDWASFVDSIMCR